MFIPLFFICNIRFVSLGVEALVEALFYLKKATAENLFATYCKTPKIQLTNVTPFFTMLKKCHKTKYTTFKRFIYITKAAFNLWCVM